MRKSENAGERIVAVIIADALRGGVGRVNTDGLFAQEDDIVEFMVTADGLGELDTFLKEKQ